MKAKVITCIILLGAIGCQPISRPKPDGTKRWGTCSVISTSIHPLRGDVYRFDLADGQQIEVENSSGSHLTIWLPKTKKDKE